MNPSEKNIDFSDTAVAFSHRSDSELQKAYWMFAVMNKGWLVKAGSFFTRLALTLHLPVKPLIRNTVFRHFCGGETIGECRETIAKLAEKHVGTILDYSVEGEENEQTFDETLRQLLHTVETAAGSRDIPFAVFKVTGLARAALLEKLQAEHPLTTEEKEEAERARKRILTLCEAAHDLQVRIFFDAEESWIQGKIDDFCYQMMELFNTRSAIVYNTYQLYRNDMLDRYRAAYDTAAAKGYYLGAKLVRGAYLEKESARAAAMGYPNPLHASKEAVDRDYNESIRFSLRRLDRLSICLGTHNEYSSRLCVDEMAALGIDRKDERIFFAQLLGMSDNISFNIALAGYNVAKYVPFGPIAAVMPYLFRRANENTAIAGQSSREFLLIREEMQRRKRAVAKVL